MKINKIKIGLIALVLFLIPTRSNSSSCLNLLKGSSAGITAVTIAECSFLMIFTGGVITSAALAAISAYTSRIMPDNSLDVQSLYQQGVAEFKATGVINPTQQELDMAGSLKAINAITSTLDTNLGYSPGTAEAFFAQALNDNPTFDFVDVVNFASNAVQTLGKTTVEIGVNSTKITLPESYRSFDDYLIRNNITTTDKLTDLITQASARSNGGLLPETYEPTGPDGPIWPIWSCWAQNREQNVSGIAGSCSDEQGADVKHDRRLYTWWIRRSSLNELQDFIDTAI